MPQGQELAAYFQKNWVGTEIRYLLFQGVPNLENTLKRSNGALQGLIDAGFTPVSAAEFQVCDFYRDRARAAMTELLAAGTAYDCVIRNNDAMALGVIDVLRDALFHLHPRRGRYDRVTRRQADKIKLTKRSDGLGAVRPLLINAAYHPIWGLQLYRP